MPKSGVARKSEDKDKLMDEFIVDTSGTKRYFLEHLSSETPLFAIVASEPDSLPLREFAIKASYWLKLLDGVKSSEFRNRETL